MPNYRERAAGRRPQRGGGNWQNCGGCRGRRIGPARRKRSGSCGKSADSMPPSLQSRSGAEQLNREAPEGIDVYFDTCWRAKRSKRRSSLLRVHAGSSPVAHLGYNGESRGPALPIFQHDYQALT